MRLIINADDFGITPSITYGIYDCIKKGIVTSTTMMVNTIGTMDAVKIIQDDRDLNVGLHFNISLGKPLTACNSLTDDKGYFIKPKNLNCDDKYDENEIYQELRAQYEKFIELNNKKPTHIDSHLYVHQIFPKVKKQMIKFSNENNLPIRAFENDNYQSVYFEGRFKVLNESNDVEMLDKLKTIISENIDKDEVELMVHPGYIDQMIINNSSYSIPRTLEANVLLSDKAKQLLVDNNIELISFKDLKRKKHG